jgi:hypothetical protein
MALPKQSTPKYNCVLPSDGREVEYRPFLVAEQKNLLIAQEQGDDGAMFSAVQDLVEACTYGKLKSTQLAVIDMEYLFLKIRAKSVGETANLQVSCHDKKCDGHGEVVINLDDVEVVGDEPENKIMINDEIGIELRYPRIGDIQTADSTEGQMTQTIEMLKKCMVSVYDQENVYPTADSSTQELDEFVNTLTMPQMELISEYFASIPQLKKEVKSECVSCGKEINTTVQGLNNFFS